MRQPREFGVVLHLARANQSFELVGERHQAGQARRASECFTSRLQPEGRERPAAPAGDLIFASQRLALAAGFLGGSQLHPHRAARSVVSDLLDQRLNDARNDGRVCLEQRLPIGV